VTNHGSTPVLVWHRGVSVRLAPGDSTTAFNGLPFSGDWGVIVDTGAYNDACPVRPGATAPPIDVQIVTSCVER
jgi:hypothetical protein